MSLDPARMAADMFGRYRAIGFKGPRLMDHCTVISQGSVMSIVGKAFATADVGSVAGAGAGIGMGLTAVPASTVKSTVVATAKGTQFKGPRLEDAAMVFADALVLEITMATLTSAHAPVFAGVGTIVPGSIPVMVNEWAGNIFTIGRGMRFIGPQWFNWCKALATGGVQGFQTATGTVVITGSPAGIPAPGGGSGAGVIS